MTIDDILMAMDTMSADDLKFIQEKPDVLRELEGFEETPEMLAAIDEGLRSAREELMVTIEELRADMRTWTLNRPTIGNEDSKEQA